MITTRYDCVDLTNWFIIIDVPEYPLGGENVHPASGIDLDFETERNSSAPQPSTYETVYVTSHKGPTRFAKIYFQQLFYSA